jgi:hypothetical protein
MNFRGAAGGFFLLLAAAATAAEGPFCYARGGIRQWRLISP